MHGTQVEVDEVPVEDAINDEADEREDAHLDRELRLVASCAAIAVPDDDAKRWDARHEGVHRLSATKVLGQTRLPGGLLVPLLPGLLLLALLATLILQEVNVRVLHDHGPSSL